MREEWFGRGAGRSGFLLEQELRLTTELGSLLAAGWLVRPRMMTTDDEDTLLKLETSSKPLLLILQLSSEDSRAAAECEGTAV